MTIAAVADSVTAGDALQFRISANPAPEAELTVTVTIAACDLAQTTASVTIAAGKSHAPLAVPTTGVAPGAEGCEVTATIAAGDGYEVGAAADASASATVRLPVVTITADSESVEEGNPVAFTLTASPPPASDLTVNVSWSGGDSFLTETPPATVTIPVSGTFALTASTDDDSVAEANDSVKVAIGAGSGYTVGSSDSATVAVTDNDTTGPTSPGGAGTPTPPSSSLPLVNIRGIGRATEGGNARFRMVASPKPASSITVSLTWDDPTGRLSSPPATVMIPKAPESAQNAFRDFAVATVQNTNKDGNARVSVTVGAGSGYEPNPDTDFSSTSILILDDDDD
ncbi:MAG: hypothetical protein OXH96_11185 [Spirochaetaceae bacterium]|nr:hypothetical protein [Spirochaetaceae bacterium]